MAKVKKKGEFQSGYTDVKHNPSGNIINDAVIAYFKDGTPPEFTVALSQDIRDFVFVQTVKGGGQFQGEHVGKVVRFYFSNTSKDALRYETSNNIVPKSENSRPVMDLPPSLPVDIDKKRYAKKAQEIIDNLIKPCKPDRNHKVFQYQDMGLSMVPFPHKGITICKPGYDYSSANAIGIQTGYRANTIGIRHKTEDSKAIFPESLTMGNWIFYQFDNRYYPGALKSVSKKLGYEVLYGGAIELTHVPQGIMSPLPKSLENWIYKALAKQQRLKVIASSDFLQ